ncbi:unnamed protein product [Chrysoparadoxa australica]
MKHYNGLKGAGAERCDVYVRAPGGEKFFFSGKVAFDSTVTKDIAVQAQKGLISDHCRRCLAFTKSPDQLPDQVEFFTAPADTEVAVAKNENDLSRAQQVEITCDVEHGQVGFMPEDYSMPGETVYYCRKADDGKSLAPPIEVKIDGMPPPNL